MNKSSTILLLLIFTFVLFSCSPSNDENKDNTDDIVDTEKEDENASEEIDKIEKEEYILYQEEIKIYGNLYKPKNKSEDDCYQLIIMSHSANVNSDTLVSYAKRSALLGYLVYIFDFPGSSGSSRSTKIDLCTIFTEMDTLSYLVDHFNSFTNIKEIYLFGTSQGGLVSSVVASEKEELIAGLILFYPAYNVPEMILKFSFLSDKKYVAMLEDYDVYKHIGNFKKEVLIVHGTNDLIVPTSYSEKAKEIYENCNLYLVEGANHGFNKENHYFNDKYDEITWKYASIYLQNHLLK